MRPGILQANESAIDDSDKPPSSTSTATTGGTGAEITAGTGKDEKGGLGRRLSQGARALYTTRMRGESINLQQPQAQSVRSASITSVSSESNPTSPNLAQSPGVAQDGFEGKIKRRMSPTGERMLRGELAFH